MLKAVSAKEMTDNIVTESQKLKEKKFEYRVKEVEARINRKIYNGKYELKMEDNNSSFYKDTCLKKMLHTQGYIVKREYEGNRVYLIIRWGNFTFFEKLRVTLNKIILGY